MARHARWAGKPSCTRLAVVPVLAGQAPLEHVQERGHGPATVLCRQTPPTGTTVTSTTTKSRIRSLPSVSLRGARRTARLDPPDGARTARGTEIAVLAHRLHRNFAGPPIHSTTPLPSLSLSTSHPLPPLLPNGGAGARVLRNILATRACPRRPSHAPSFTGSPAAR